MLKFLSVIVFAVVTVSPTFAPMARRSPPHHIMYKAPPVTTVIRPHHKTPDHTQVIQAPHAPQAPQAAQVIQAPHAPQAATQPMQPSRGMFNNPNEFRAPLIVVLTEMKRLGGGGLPVPNLGRFVGGGNTKIDNQITPDQLADKLFQIEPKAGNKCMLSIHQNDKYWDALLNDLRGGRGQNPAYMAEIQKLRELQSKLVVFK